MSQKIETWLFTHSQLSHCPSVQDKTCKDAIHELSERSKCAKFIQDCGRDLRLDCSALYISCLYMHRFYCRRSMADYNTFDTGATCLFLTCKLEETFRKPRDLIAVVSKHASKAELTQSLFSRWSSRIIAVEDALVEMLCFDFSPDVAPYMYLDNLVKALAAHGIIAKAECPHIHSIMLAWSLDVAKSFCVLLYPAVIIAGVCAYLTGIHWRASEFNKDKLKWMEVICVFVERWAGREFEGLARQIKDGCSEVLKLRDFGRLEAAALCEAKRKEYEAELQAHRSYVSVTPINPERIGRISLPASATSSIRELDTLKADMSVQSPLARPDTPEEGEVLTDEDGEL